MDPSLPTSISTRAEFNTALLAALQDAVRAGTRELWLVDPDFADWPLGERATVELLTQWAQAPQRRITLIARHFDEMPRRHPRFVQWRRHWSHFVEARAVADLDPSDVPTLLLAGDGLGVQLLDRVHWRGRWFSDEADWRTWREVVDALLQRSSDAFPATTLGI
jgi:peptidyl-tRNA hydrolase